MVAMATSLRCRGIGNICILSTTTQTPLHNQLPSRYGSYKASYSNFSSKIGCHGNVPQHLWTIRLKSDSYGPSEPTTQTASLSVQPSLHRRP